MFAALGKAVCSDNEEECKDIERSEEEEGQGLREEERGSKDTCLIGNIALIIGVC